MKAPELNAPRQPPRRWLIPASIAAILFVGGVAGNLVASDLDPIYQPYRWVVYVVFGVAFVVAVLTALQGIREANAPPLPDSDLHRLKPPPRDFTGRAAELAQLLSHLERDGVTVVGVQGMGGVGKTTLALELARQLKPRYPDAQFLLDLKGPSPQPQVVVEAMRHVILAYDRTLQLPDSEAEMNGIYHSVLDGQRALLLLDNAAGREQVEALLPPVSCAVIVTSRQHFELPGMFALNLDVLPPDDARKLLLKISPRIGKYADALAERCGYLPFALRLAASALEAERRNLKLEEYLRRLEDARQRLELFEATLSLSYDLLRPELQQRWCLLAALPEAFDVALAAAVWEVEADAAQDALGTLLAYGMVEWNEATDRYHLHDLMRLFADSRLDEAARIAAKKRHVAHYLTVLSEAERLYQQGGDALLFGAVAAAGGWMKTFVVAP